MTITKNALSLIDTGDIRCKLAIALGKSEMQIRRYIKHNDVMLTTAAALLVIKKETGLKQSEILTAVQSDSGDEVEPIYSK